MALITYLLNTGPRMLGEEDGKILTTTSIISLHAQALKHPAIISNEVNGYCSMTSDLIMVHMQASCIEMGCVRIQIVYLVQFKLLNMY